MRLKEFYELYVVRVSRVMASATPERRNKISSSNLSVRSGLGLTTVLRSVLCSLSLTLRGGDLTLSCSTVEIIKAPTVPCYLAYLYIQLMSLTSPALPALPAETCDVEVKGGTKKEKKEENSGVHVGHLDLNLADEPSCYLSARASC